MLRVWGRLGGIDRRQGAKYAKDRLATFAPPPSFFWPSARVKDASAGDMALRGGRFTQGLAKRRSDGGCMELTGRVERILNEVRPALRIRT